MIVYSLLYILATRDLPGGTIALCLCQYLLVVVVVVSLTHTCIHIHIHMHHINLHCSYMDSANACCGGCTYTPELESHVNSADGSEGTEVFGTQRSVS
jgi:hypothetical protein